MSIDELSVIMKLQCICKVRATNTLLFTLHILVLLTIKAEEDQRNCCKNDDRNRKKVIEGIVMPSNRDVHRLGSLWYRSPGWTARRWIPPTPKLKMIKMAELDQLLVKRLACNGRGQT